MQQLAVKWKSNNHGNNQRIKNYKTSIYDYNLGWTQKKPELVLIIHMQFKHQYIDMWTSF